MLLHLRFKLSTLCRQLEARRNSRRAFPLRYSFVDKSDDAIRAGLFLCDTALWMNLTIYFAFCFKNGVFMKT